MSDYARSTSSVYINEIFESIQGEGSLTGFRTLFIRFQGCHIGCAWCDSKKSWSVKDTAEKIKGAELIKIVRDKVSPDTWICITGGEPFEQLKALLWFSQRLYRYNYRKQSIETAGIVAYDNNGGIILPDKKAVIDLFYNDVFMSVSPKLKSALGKRFEFEALKNIVMFWIETYPVYYKFQLKFVVSIEEDLEILTMLKERIRSFSVHNLYVQIDFNRIIKDNGFIKQVFKWLDKNQCYRLSIQQHRVLNMR